MVDDVVQGLLCRQALAGGLGVELQLFGRVGLGVVPLVHDAGVDPSRSSELRDLLEQRVVAVEEERERRRELVDVEATVHRVLDVREPISQRERELLHRGAAGFADVVARDGDRVELRGLLGTELDDVGDEVEAGLRRDHPLLLRDELLEHVVLEGAPDLLARDALLVR